MSDYFEPRQARQSIPHQHETEDALNRVAAAQAAEVKAKPVKQARDRAQYVRQQKGHSFVMEWLVFGIFTCFIRPIYFAVSPNHYFHL